MDPYRASLSSVYEEFVEQNKTILAEELTTNKELEDALRSWYRQSIIEQVASNKSSWFRYPEIVLDDLELSWRAHYALSRAEILNLNQIWETHGKDNSLTDCENTGLNQVRGLGYAEISEILDLLTNYMRRPLDPSLASSIIEYAESLLSDECDLERPPVCLSNTVVYFLLKMGYRDLKDVLNDFQNGNLACKVEQIEDYDVRSDVLRSIGMHHCGEFPVQHYAFDPYWRSVLKDNPGKVYRICVMHIFKICLSNEN